jgi:hypothetical protein
MIMMNLLKFTPRYLSALNVLASDHAYLDGERSLFISEEYIIYATASVTACVEFCPTENYLDMTKKWEKSQM